MYKPNYVTLVLIALLLSNFPAFLFGQCQKSAAVLINEVGVYYSPKDLSFQGQFLELFVVGDPASGEKTVNLSGWIVDDNNSTNLKYGTNPGHLVLGEAFQEIPLGSTILLYQGEVSSFGIEPKADGWPNENGIYQLNYLEAKERAQVSYCGLEPNEESSGYSSNCQGKFGADSDASKKAQEMDAKMDQSDIIKLNWDGDAIQLRNDKKELVHAIKWGKINFPEEKNAKTILMLGAKLEGSFIAFNMSETPNWYDTKNYTLTTKASAGDANSERNKEFLYAAADGKYSALNGAQTCYICKEGCVKLQPSIKQMEKGYTFTWTDSNGNTIKSKSPELEVCPTTKTEYYFTLKNEFGVTVAVKTFKVMVKS